MVAPLLFRAISCDLPRKLWKAVGLVTTVDGNEKKQLQSCKKAVDTPFREPDEHKEKAHLGIEASELTVVQTKRSHNLKERIISREKETDQPEKNDTPGNRDRPIYMAWLELNEVPP
ncbi:hypothetical protein FB45DRAFT_873862 [Roridomyces roridus]|uniref:Uncharacterized protein n=1 Tax=Roridomyces roridus TaxID=1738132 RepID=A0AAD7FC42_9AGAR|nr:hypothetical protein FB45DRAFT_873862 [Roridomyces roridus]